MKHTTEYESAKAEWQAALVRLSAATTKLARRDAAEDVEFWGSKMAALGQMAEAK